MPCGQFKGPAGSSRDLRAVQETYGRFNAFGGSMALRACKAT